MKQPKTMGLVLIISSVALLGYVWGGLVWDDHMLLTQGLWKSDSIAAIWMQSVQGGKIASQYYRPIPMTIFAIVQSITILHSITLLVHLGSTWLLSQWLSSRFEESNIVYAGTLLFALHPIQTEVLGWASCLPDILAVHFGLWAVVFALQKRSSVLVACALLCGLLSKEIALLPLLAFALDSVWTVYREEERWNLPRWGLPVVVVFIAFGVIRVLLQVETVFPSSFETVPRTTFVTIGMGWFSWLVPFPHYPVRDVWVLPMSSVYVGWAWCIISLITVRNTMGWLIAMGGLLLSLPPIWVGYFAAERYLYVATIGFVWITCTVLHTNRIAPKILKVVCVVWVLSTGIIHWSRAQTWSNDERLFTEAVNTLPTSGYTWHLQGMAQIQRGEFAKAFDSFKTGSEQQRIHHQSREFAIRSALEAGLAMEAFHLAEQGPKEGLSKGYLEAWLQAARAVGQKERTLELERALGL